MGDAFQVGLGEKVASHCQANDAPELSSGTFALFAGPENVMGSWGGMKKRMRKSDSHRRQESI